MSFESTRLCECTRGEKQHNDWQYEP
jgi:hypothetical protein